MGLGPWIDLDAPALPGPEALPDRTDVVVVGGGLAGVSAAWFLADAGAEVVLCEALPAVGLRHSGRTLGLVDNALLEHPHRTVKALGDERAAALFRLAETNADLLDEAGLLDRCGSLWAALDKREPDEIDASVADLERLGFPAERVDDVDRRTGGYNFGPGLWRPTGGRIDPLTSVNALAAAAEQNGAVLVGNAEVDRIHDGDDGPEVHIGDRVVRAEVVIVAAGWASGALEPALDGRLHPVREQSLMTAPIFAYYPLSGRAGHGYTSFRQLEDGHLVVSGCRWATPHLETGETDDTVIVDRIQAKLDAFFRFHFPAGEETPVIDRWARVFAQSVDGLPFVGPLPGSPQRLALCGFGAYGASFAVAAAKGLVDGVLLGERALPADFDPVRMMTWRHR